MPKTLAACCLALGLAFATSAQAQGLGNLWDEQTYMTFNEEVQLPGGETLPAGRYLFKIKMAETLSSPTRDIVEVRSEDGTRLIATVTSQPIQSDEIPQEPTVTFFETPADMPRAVHMWFYPGQRWGHEFIYPREQAMRIATAANRSVLASDSDESTVARVNPGEADVAQRTESQSSTMTAQRSESAATTEQAAEAPTTTADRPVGTSGMTQSETTQSTASQSQAQTQTRQRLPQTASQVNLLALIGLLSLAGAVSVRAYAAARQ